MMDMMQVIQPKSDQINADDLIGGDMVYTVDGVNIKSGDDQPVSIKLRGDRRVYRPCKSMARVLVKAWGADASKYAGKRMRLFCDPDVKWGGMAVGGIRIRALSHIDGPMSMVLTETRSKRGIFKVDVIADEKPTPHNAHDLARAAAKRGRAAFAAWWKTDEGAACRDACAPIMAEIERIVLAAEERNKTDDDDGPPI